MRRHKKYIVIMFSVFFCSNPLFAQKNDTITINSDWPPNPERAPRFYQDTLISEHKSKSIFNERIKAIISKKLEVGDMPKDIDSTTSKLILTFAIDTIGKAHFIEVSEDYLGRNVLNSKGIRDFFKEIINGLPQFKPGSMYRKPIKVKYTIPINVNHQYK